MVLVWSLGFSNHQINIYLKVQILGTWVGFVFFWGDLLLVINNMERESEKKFVEESGLTFSDVPKLCVNNCVFFGSSATNNLCSKCYKDDLMKRSKALVVEKPEMRVEENGVDEKMGFIGGAEEEKIVKINEGTTYENRPANGCSFCRKRVGLMGFKCRCGHTFCSIHRYSDKHHCIFDYKGAGQDAIAKSNPVVKADKIEKI